MTTGQADETLANAPDAREDAALAAMLLDGGMAQVLNLTPADLQIGLRVARGHEARGDLAGALRLYAMLVLCDPMDLTFQRSLAQCGLAAGEFALTVQAASVLIAGDSRSPAGYLLSGLGCAGLGAGAEAREDLERATQLAREAGDAGLARAAETALATLSERPAAA